MQLEISSCLLLALGLTGPVLAMEELRFNDLQAEVSVALLAPGFVSGTDFDSSVTVQASWRRLSEHDLEEPVMLVWGLGLAATMQEGGAETGYAELSVLSLRYHLGLQWRLGRQWSLEAVPSIGIGLSQLSLSSSLVADDDVALVGEYAVDLRSRYQFGRSSFSVGLGLQGRRADFKFAAVEPLEFEISQFYPQALFGYAFRF